ncbi:hypothetical protein ABZV60_29535 [Streptomyces sp. NPDC004787]|uniref:hypothetical protein n=1 Tax=Streptomyces sp. NPDC004787 TaxID=3154291 RepID=UPI0033B9BBA2
MSVQGIAPYETRLTDVVWALPPMGGALGAALAWRVLLKSMAVPAAHEVVYRQLMVWQIEPTTAHAVGQVVSKLIEQARKHQATALFMELAYGNGGVALAFRSDSGDGAGNHAICLAARELQATHRYAGTELLEVPGQGNAMITRFCHKEGSAE